MKFFWMAIEAKRGQDLNSVARLRFYVVFLGEKRVRETAGGFNHHAPYDIQRKVGLNGGVKRTLTLEEIPHPLSIEYRPGETLEIPLRRIPYLRKGFHFLPASCLS